MKTDSVAKQTLDLLCHMLTAPIAHKGGMAAAKVQHTLDTTHIKHKIRN